MHLETSSFARINIELQNKDEKKKRKFSHAMFNSFS